MGTAFDMLKIKITQRVGRNVHDMGTRVYPQDTEQVHDDLIKVKDFMVDNYKLMGVECTVSKIETGVRVTTEHETVDIYVETAVHDHFSNPLNTAIMRELNNYLDTL